MTANHKSQLDNFKEAAGQLKADEDPECLKERLRKLVRHKLMGKAE